MPEHTVTEDDITEAAINVVRLTLMAERELVRTQAMKDVIDAARRATNAAVEVLMFRASAMTQVAVDLGKAR